MLVEDSRIMREALTFVLSRQPDLQLVATAADADEALAAGVRTRPDVVLMDITLRARDGVDATRELCREVTGVRVVILSGSCSRDLITSAFGAGACGYLVKDGSHRQLIDAIHLAADGGRPLTDCARRVLGK
jgi:DNA-binding NarL/FixJ family response regulator